MGLLPENHRILDSALAQECPQTPGLRGGGEVSVAIEHVGTSQPGDMPAMQEVFGWGGHIFIFHLTGADSGVERGQGC